MQSTFLRLYRLPAALLVTPVLCSLRTQEHSGAAVRDRAPGRARPVHLHSLRLCAGLLLPRRSREQPHRDGLPRGEQQPRTEGSCSAQRNRATPALDRGIVGPGQRSLDAALRNRQTQKKCIYLIDGNLLCGRPGAVETGVRDLPESIAKRLWPHIYFELGN